MSDRPVEDKEQIHDRQIAPLMDKIIAIARAHGIAMVASFELGEKFFCTTALNNETGKSPPEFLKARNCILNETSRPVPRTTAMTIRLKGN